MRREFALFDIIFSAITGFREALSMVIVVLRRECVVLPVFDTQMALSVTSFLQMEGLGDDSPITLLINLQTYSSQLPIEAALPYV